MKKLLFTVVSFVGANSIRLTQAVFGGLGALVANIGEILVKTIAKTCCALMTMLDPTAMKLVEKITEAQEKDGPIVRQHTELRLLSAASHVKDHAEVNGEWTDNHSDALEAISNALLNECEWEEDDIHAYMKRLVESIDGLEYGTEER